MNKYLTSISKDEKSKKEGELALQAQAAALQLESDLHAVKTELLKATSKAASVVLEVPFNSNNIIVAQRTKANLEEDLRALEAIKAEYFSE